MSYIDDRAQRLLTNREWRRNHSWWVVGIAIAFILPPLAPLGFVYPLTKSARKMWWVLFSVLVAVTVGFYVVAAVGGHASLGLFIRMTDVQGLWVAVPYALWALDLLVAVAVRPVLLRELARVGAERAGRLTSPAAAQGIDQFPVHDARTWPPDR
ncbi:MAG: hypothetical protein FWH11_06465 [Micrococcales bacterium]|nr:hypothetical protein [Micrococcales bacterium]